MADLEFRTTSTSSLGSASTPSLGRYASSAAPSVSNGGWFDDITTGQQDANTIDYRAIIIYNPTGSALNVKVSIAQKPSQAVVSIGADTTAATAIANQLTVASPANENTAPSGVTFTTGILTLGAIGAGEGKAIWVKRTARGTAAKTNDALTIKAYTY